MVTNKKLVAYCLIALIVGAATIVPLGLFLMTQLDKEPQFNLNVSYAYIDNYWANDTSKIQKNYGLVYAVTFEATARHNLQQFPYNIFPYADAVSDYYTLELLSEKGSIGNLSYQITQITNRPITSGSFFRPPTQDGGSVGYGNGTYFGYIEGSTQNLNISLGKPDSITLIVRREAWVVFKNNATTTYSADSKIVAQVELQPYGDGFIYNKLFTQEQLSRINPVMPQYEVP